MKIQVFFLLVIMHVATPLVFFGDNQKQNKHKSFISYFSLLLIKVTQHLDAGGQMLLRSFVKLE